MSDVDGLMMGLDGSTMDVDGLMEVGGMLKVVDA